MVVAPFGLLFAAVSSEAGLKVSPSADGDEPEPARLAAALPAFAIGIGVNPHFSPPFYSATAPCVVLPRSVGSERRIATERRPTERRPQHPCSRAATLCRVFPPCSY